MEPNKITDRFKAVCTRLQAMDKDDPDEAKDPIVPTTNWAFRFHDLRHFSVTTLIAAGVDIRTVAERHGHAQATMTLNRYAHALPESDRAAAGILGKTFDANMARADS
jgi:integrase